MLRRILNTVGVVLCANAIILAWWAQAPAWATAAGASALLALLVEINMRPYAGPAPTPRIRSLAGGAELIFAGQCSMVAQLLLYAGVFIPLRSGIGTWPLVANAGLGIAVTAIVVINGCLRVIIRSTQLGLGRRFSVVWWWWVPGLGWMLLQRTRLTARDEARFVTTNLERDERRREAQICRTRYPIVMVHGIFFRDWQHFNYWGRIPDALARNGASVFYGGQQSSSSVADSAAELVAAIENVCRATGAAKVNIIAHSKGGLDSRYAISCLGLGGRVASLTTVNTPHLGTPLAGRLLTKTPEAIAGALDKRYDALFAKLGDDQPDFLGGVSELTPQACAALGTQMPDDPRVMYLSCGSVMRTAASAPFPMNIGYQIIWPIAGDNDGLVDSRSMAWGEFLALVRGSGKLGVSHGDMIDLWRRNIPGFDVCEFYVQLVAELRQRGC